MDWAVLEKTQNEQRSHTEAKERCVGMASRPRIESTLCIWRVSTDKGEHLRASSPYSQAKMQQPDEVFNKDVLVGFH